MFDFSSQLLSGAKILGIKVSKDSCDQLEIYFRELKKWSQKINLIAKSTSDEQIAERHFLDSLTLLPFLVNPGAHLLDIGTGAGFPGLVCKIVQPELTVTLMEPRLKRVSFLKHIVRTLQLDDVTILSCRVEDKVQLPSDRIFSHITGRALAEIGPFLQMVERFSATGPQLVCMKGPKWQEELDEAAGILGSSSYKLEQVAESVLPFTGAKRCHLLFETK